MSHPRLVLASASPRRRQLLRLLNVPFQVLTTDVDETPQPGESPTNLVRRLSRLKAEAAQSHDPGTLVIAADTDVELDGAILGKPRDERQAREMLRALRGREHTVHGGITIANPTLPLPDEGSRDPTLAPLIKSKISRRPRGPAGLEVEDLPQTPRNRGARSGAEGAKRRGGRGRGVTLVVHTRVWMRNYSDAEIEAYVATGDPLDKAAAYAVQHRVLQPVALAEGCFANVMGLALCHLHNALSEHYPLPEPAFECHLHPDKDCTIARLVAEGKIAGA